MSSPFFPEMHDLAKLVNRKGSFPTVDGNPLSLDAGKIFANLDWKAIGLHPSSKSPTLKAILCAGDGQFLDWETVEDPEARKCLFLLALAHQLASAFENPSLPWEGDPVPTLYKLWQSSSITARALDYEPIVDTPSLRKALELALSPQKQSAFWEQFSASMEIRSDHSLPPFNVTSLLSHSVLTGQFYRALAEQVEMLQNPWRLSLDGVEASSLEEAREKWVVRIVWGQAHFYQQPITPADLRVFDKLKSYHRRLCQEYPNNLIGMVSNHFWLFLPGNRDEDLSRIAQLYLDGGFYVRLRYQEMPLAELGQSQAIEFRIGLLEAMAAELQRLAVDLTGRQNELQENLEEEKALLQELEAEIAKLEDELSRLTSPKTRSATRRRKKELEKRRDSTLERLNHLERALTSLQNEMQKIGEETEWVQERLKQERAAKNAGLLWHQVVFHIPELSRRRKPTASVCQVCGVRPASDDSRLCTVCREIRGEASGSRVIPSWLSEGHLLWMHCHFEPRLWQHAILSLFSNYVDKSNPEGKWEVSLRFRVKTALRWPVLLRDFLTDYQNFLREMELEVCKLVGAKNRIRLADDLWVLPINKGTKINALIRSYVNLLERFFPALASLPDLPIYLGISIAPASQTFYEQWRYLKRPPQPISVRLAGQERLEVGIDVIRELIRYGESLITYRQRRRPSLEQVRIEELVARNVIKRQDVKAYQRLTEWQA